VGLYQLSYSRPQNYLYEEQNISMSNNAVKALKVIFCVAFLAACSQQTPELNTEVKLPSKARWHNNQGVVYMSKASP
jgi:uncharacterized lipoprotein YajG